MSLLNLTNDGKRGVLVAVFKLLAAEGTTPKERVLSVCAPEGVAERSHASQTLNTWTELGLFRVADEDVSIHPDIPSRERTTECLPMLARTRALAPDNNERLWEATESRSADFTRAVTWLLAQDVYSAEHASWEDVEPVLQRQIPGNHSIFGQNNTRWNGLRSWGPYLGFGYVGNRRGSAFIVDPTAALRDALPGIFGRKKSLLAEDFLTGVAREVPVLDGGIYREQVEERLRERSGAETWQAPPSGQLSTSLSRSLLRLTADGTLAGESHSDAPGRARLTGRDREVITEFTHFVYQPAR